MQVIARTFAMLVLCALTIPAPSTAHSSGVSLTQDVGIYTIDIGYNPLVLDDGESAVFDFLFLEASSSVPYDHVWVRITENKETVLATGVKHQKFGPTTLVYRFPHAGTFLLEASYRDADGDTLADAKFPLTIAASDSGSPYSRVGVVAALILIGAGAIAALSYAMRVMMRRDA